MKILKLFLLVLTVCLISVSSLCAQIQVAGSNPSYYKLTKAGEYSITVNLWGYVKNPGRYEVPGDCDIVQLLSFAGGPSEHSDLENIKLFRVRPDSSQVRQQDLTIVDLDHMMQSKNRPMLLQHGDTIILESTSYPFWISVLSIFRDVTLIVYSIAVVYQIVK